MVVYGYDVGEIFVIVYNINYSWLNILLWYYCMFRYVKVNKVSGF